MKKNCTIFTELTNQSSVLAISIGHGLIVNEVKDSLQKMNFTNNVSPIHLNVCSSEEEIVVGDIIRWYVLPLDAGSWFTEVTEENIYDTIGNDACKVIASTNESYNLPKIADKFIKYYAGLEDRIVEVMVQYTECELTTTESEDVEKYDRLDLRPLDNTIKITVNDEYSWKDMELMLSEFICKHCPETSSQFSPGMFLNDWINENLTL